MTDASCGRRETAEEGGGAPVEVVGVEEIIGADGEGTRGAMPAGSLAVFCHIGRP